MRKNEVAHTDGMNSREGFFRRIYMICVTIYYILKNKQRLVENYQHSQASIVGNLYNQKRREVS